MAKTKTHNERTAVARCSYRPGARMGFRPQDMRIRRLSARPPVPTEYQNIANDQLSRRRTTPQVTDAKIADRKPTVANSRCSSWLDESPLHPGSHAKTPAPIRPTPSRPMSPAASVNHHPPRKVASRAEAKQRYKKPVKPKAAYRIMTSVELPRSPSSLTKWVTWLNSGRIDPARPISDSQRNGLKMPHRIPSLRRSICKAVVACAG